MAYLFPIKEKTIPMKNQTKFEIKNSWLQTITPRIIHQNDKTIERKQKKEISLVYENIALMIAHFLWK